jgi:hypothetical protein
LKVVYALLLALVLLASAESGVARADGWTPAQLRVIQIIYEEAEYWGLRDADRDLMLRIAYRETGFGADITGDHNGQRNLSIGVFQWHEGGLWQSTPCFREYGWAGRWIERADIHCAAWAFNRGMQSHWMPSLQVRWLSQVPPDPRVKGAYEPIP